MSEITDFENLPDYVAPIDSRDAIISALRAELSTARALLDKAAEALMPFAKLPIGILDEDKTVSGTILHPSDDNDLVYHTHGWPSDSTAKVVVGDLRRARTILDEIRRQRHEQRI